jgi:hypothetical protein
MARAARHQPTFPLTWKTSGRGAKPRCRARSRTFRPSLDVLEDRATPSTFQVTNALDPRGALAPGSLRWAVAQANRPGNQGSTVEITEAVQGPITLRAGELRINSSMTIENDSGLPLTIQQGTPNARVVHVVGNSRATGVTLTGQGATSPLTLTGGKAVNGNGGGILVDNPSNTLTLAHVNVNGNAAVQIGSPRLGKRGNGGGIYSRGTVTLDHSSVSANSASGPNSATGQAGGVYTDQGVSLNASHVDANTARNAGGILNVTGTVQVLDGSTVNGNSSTGHSFQSDDFGGGGIGQMNGNVIVSASEVSHNKTVGMYSGGIVLLIGGATITDGSHVDGNTNNGPGGGIAANFGGPVVVSNGSTVNGNTGAGLGGGIVNFSETFGVTVTGGSQVNDNVLTNAEPASVTTGLLEVDASFLSSARGDALLRSMLRLFIAAIAQRAGAIRQAAAQLPADGNVQVGGGISSPLTGPIELSGGSEVSGNRFAQVIANKLAVGVGGGIFANLGPITIDGGTVSDNVATGDGGGIWNGHSLTISNSAVVRNRAATRGGGIFNRGAFTSTNSIVADNSPDNIDPPS